MISVGTLSIISLSVIFVVSPSVFAAVYFTIRSRTQKLNHCGRCHAKMFIDGARVPPYYDADASLRAVVDQKNSRISFVLPREKSTNPSARRSRTSRNISSSKSETKSEASSQSKSRDQAMKLKTPKNTSLLRRSDNDFVFQRSCSTRKKPAQLQRPAPNSEDVELNETGQNGLFRLTIND